MSSNPASASVSELGEVMAAIEGTPRTLIIADVTRDDAWLSMALDDTVSVTDIV